MVLTSFVVCIRCLVSVCSCTVQIQCGRLLRCVTGEGSGACFIVGVVSTPVLGVSRKSLKTGVGETPGFGVYLIPQKGVF